MNNKDHDIYEYFANLPKKSIPQGDKERAWFNISNHIRTTRSLDHLQPLGWFWRFKNAAVIALVVFVSVSIIGGVAQASKESLPGETLYPFKKAVERVEIVLASGNDVKKAHTLRQHARARIKEVQTLVEEKKASDQLVAETIQALKETTNKVVAASEETPELVDDALILASEEEAVLVKVQDDVGGEIKQIVEAALSASRESASKLREKQSQQTEETVKGTQNESETATSSSPTTSSNESENQTSEQVESPTQIHDVIKIDGEEEEDEPDEEPEILDEPSR